MWHRTLALPPVASQVSSACRTCPRQGTVTAMADADAASSPTQLPYDPHAHLRTDAVQFIDIVTKHGFEHRVPSCPDWNLGDLAWHLGNVWYRWGRIVSEGITTLEGVQAIATPSRPSDEMLIDWVTASNTAVVAALAQVSDDTEVWTWTGSNQPEIWVERRMTQETAMHRWDAASAVGIPYEIPIDVAADGIDEFLTWFAARRAAPGALTVDGTVHLHCTDTGDVGGVAPVHGEWLVNRLDESGIEFTREHAKGDAAVRGRANDLLLWLWRRTTGGVEILGDAAVAERFRAYPDL